MNVEICASKVVADNPSASAPQQGNTKMACIATLVWMRVKADYDLAVLREGPAGHSSGAVRLTSAGRRFPECLLVFPIDIGRRSFGQNGVNRTARFSDSISSAD
jgi:hypothetical protein